MSYDIFYDLQLFADSDMNLSTQTSTGYDMSPEMKTYYDTELLENARKDLYFAQFGKRQPLPKNHGNKVEWRKWNTFAKALDPISEATTPTGQKFGATKIETNLTQHGTFTKISDKLELQTIDDVILGATEEMGASAGETMDTLIRNALAAGTNVSYADDVKDGTETPVASRTDITNTCVLSSKLVNRVATKLKKAKAPKIDGKYVMVVHPSCTYDIRSDPDWIEAHKYMAATEIFNGEIGELHGVRFIESDNVKVIAPAVIYSTGSAPFRRLTVKTEAQSSAITVTVNEKVTNNGSMSVKVYVNGIENTVTKMQLSGENTQLTLSTALTEAVPAGAVICGQGAGRFGCDIYCNMAFGRDGYGIIDPEGAGLEMIIHDKASGGTSNPLNLWSTIGYKFMYGCKILYPERVIRVECGSAFGLTDDEN